MMLTEPLPWQTETEAQRENEGELFMAALAQHKKG